MRGPMIQQYLTPEKVGQRLERTVDAVLEFLPSGTAV